MIQNILEDKIIIHKEQPFYNYINGVWSTGNNNFTYTQRYSRGGGNPLSNFIDNGTQNLDNFLYSYFKMYGIKYEGLTNNFKNEILQFFNDFYNEFMNNKNIIDTERTASGAYKWNGGETTATINLNTSVSIIDKRTYQIKKNQLILKSKYYDNPQYIYRLTISSINSSRW